MIIGRTKLCEVSLEKCASIARFLNDDFMLIEKLGTQTQNRTCNEVFEDLMKWQIEKRGISRIIEEDGEVVGLISLSRINYMTKSGSIGYWIGSKYWNRGIGKRAFRKCLELATMIGLEKVQGIIEESNIPSRRIWQRYSHEKEYISNERIKYMMIIKSNDITIAST